MTFIQGLNNNFQRTIIMIYKGRGLSDKVAFYQLGWNSKTQNPLRSSSSSWWAKEVAKLASLLTHSWSTDYQYQGLHPAIHHYHPTEQSREENYRQWRGSIVFFGWNLEIVGSLPLFTSFGHGMREVEGMAIEFIVLASLPFFFELIDLERLTRKRSRWLTPPTTGFTAGLNQMVVSNLSSHLIRRAWKWNRPSDETMYAAIPFFIWHPLSLLWKLIKIIIYHIYYLDLILISVFYKIRCSDTNC